LRWVIFGAMEISHAVTDDAHAIARVHIGSWQAAYAHIVDPEWLAALSVDDRTSRWQRILASRRSTTLVARREGHVIGFVSYGACRDPGAPEDQGEIWALYASPEVWGQGVGLALTMRSLGDLERAGFKSTSLWVLEENRRGLDFYRSCGFRPVAGSHKEIELGGRVVTEIAMLRINDA